MEEHNFVHSQLNKGRSQGRPDEGFLIAYDF
jgi:hypothetical protein